MDFTLGGIVISVGIVVLVGTFTFSLLWSRQRKMRLLKKQLEIGVELKRAIKVIKQSQQIVAEHEKQMLKIEASVAKTSQMGVAAQGQETDPEKGGCLKICVQGCLHPAGAPQKEMAEIGFHDLSLTIDTTGATVLDDLSGIIRPGELTAIMGPSGSGKTSFMTAIAGRAHYGTLHGSLLLNGEPIDPKSRGYQRKIGFVPQNDIMHANLTVFETLVYTSRIRLPEVSKIEQMRNVNHAISQLRLDNVQHSIIGDESKRGISGGQKKRVNIGIEMVAQPSILFCDEATSGLDSGNSLLVVKMLHKIAQDLVTVVTVLHQPREEIFDTFDEVILLGVGGKTIYHGDAEKVVDYFATKELNYEAPSSQNPADFLIDVVVGDRLPELAAGDEHAYDNPAKLAHLLMERLKEKYSDPADRSSYKMFQKMDREQVGVVHYLQFEEWVHSLTNDIKLHEDVIKKAYESIDDEGNDLITPSEFNHWLRSGEGGKVTHNADANSRGAKERAAKQQQALVNHWRKLHVDNADVATQVRESGRRVAMQNKTAEEKSDHSSRAKKSKNCAVDLLGDVKEQFITLAVLFSRDTQSFIRSFKDILSYLLMYMAAGALLGAVFVNSENDGNYLGPLEPRIQELCPESLRTACEAPRVNPMPVQSSFIILALGLLGLTSSQRVFGSEKEKVVWFREAEAGLPTIPYFLSKLIIQMVLVLAGPGLFLVMYYSIRQPRAYMPELYQIYVVSTIVAFGHGYMISLFLHEKQAIVASILTQLVFTMLSGVTPTLHVLHGNVVTRVLSSANWCRWVQEWHVITELEYYRNIYNTTTTYSMLMYDYSFDEPDEAKALYQNYTLLIGLVVHVLAISVIFWRAGARGQAFVNHYVMPVINFLLFPVKAAKKGIEEASEMIQESFSDRDTEGEGTGEVAIDVNTPPGFSKPAEK
jgi:ABC-type multidrug transport system ATPase subunit